MLSKRKKGHERYVVVIDKAKKLIQWKFKQDTDLYVHDTLHVRCHYKHKELKIMIENHAREKSNTKDIKLIIINPDWFCCG